MYLKANMTSRYTELVQGLTIDPDEPYTKVRGRLLEAAGFTTRDVGLKLLQMETKDIRGKTALETFQTATRLIKRMFKGAETVHDFIVVMLLPIMRKILPKEGVTFMDNRNPSSTEEILETLQNWWSISGGVQEGGMNSFKPKVHSSPFRSSQQQQACYNCGRPGHKAVDCWMKASSSGANPKPVMDGNPMWTSFSCGKKGTSPRNALRRGTEPRYLPQRSSRKRKHKSELFSIAQD